MPNHKKMVKSLLKKPKSTSSQKDACPVCGKKHGKRLDLKIFCTKEELDSINLIISKIQCANQAARPDAIPNGVAADKIRLFVQAAIDAKANYLWLEKDWWNNAIKKYALPQDKRVFIDFNSGVFYILEE